MRGLKAVTMQSTQVISNTAHTLKSLVSVGTDTPHAIHTTSERQQQGDLLGNLHVFTTGRDRVKKSVPTDHALLHKRKQK